VYRNEQIAVSWEPKLCIHAGYCFRGLPEVFQPESRPWVKVDAATADKIAEVVMTCPTGALHFERLDGGAQELKPEDVGYIGQNLVLGKHSGRHAFRDRVVQLGFPLDDAALQRAFDDFIVFNGIPEGYFG